jgi:hypothetical protein
LSNIAYCRGLLSRYVFICSLYNLGRDAKSDYPTHLRSNINVQDGKPYILSVQAGATIPDPRSQGHTLAVRTVFESLEDMRYYDSECEAHKALKRVAVGKREGDVLAVYFEDAVGAKSLV